MKQQTDWLFYAQEYLPSRTKQHSYVTLAIELTAMQDAGLCRQKYAVSYKEWALILSQILQWNVDRTSLYKQMQKVVFHDDEYASSLHFWTNLIHS